MWNKTAPKMEQGLSTSLEIPGDLQVKWPQQQKGPS